jgi:hypothetical protein
MMEPGEVDAMQFRFISTMVLVALIALALTGLRSPTIGDDGVKLLLFGILFYAGFSAAYRRGRQRAFWLGFSIATLLQVGRLRGWVDDAVPLFGWTGSLTTYVAENIMGGAQLNNIPQRNALFGIIPLVPLILTCLIGGLIASIAFTRAGAVDIHRPRHDA